MNTSSTTSERPETKRMPLRPGVVPAPSMLSPRRITSMVFGVAVALSLILKPLMPPELSVLPNVLVMRCLLGTAGRVPALDIQTPTELQL